MSFDDQIVLDFAKREAEVSGIEVELNDSDNESFSVSKQAGGWVVSAGKARSLLWGVYHIKDGGGVGQYTTDFSIRGIFPCEAPERTTPDQMCSMIDRMARWRMNRLIVRWHYGYQDHAPLIHRLCAERGIELSFYMESVLMFCKDAEPELFARNEDGQPVTPVMVNETRLCPSKPEAVEYFRRGAQRFFANTELPAGTRIVFIDADGYRFCHCDKCKDIRPVDQWARFFEVIIQEAEKAPNKVNIEYPCYVWRYALPDNLSMLDGISGILYDTHQRVRWKALGEDHPLTHYSELESKGDPAAAAVPMNRYMYDRLLEWRNAFSKPIYVFENLMIQGSISCPQPYTPQLLEDIEKFRNDKIDGVIYEAFEPGMPSFSDQIGTLARAMWSDRSPYQPTKLEKLCATLDDSDCTSFNFRNCFNVLAYLTTEKFDGVEALKTHIDDPVMHEYAFRLKIYLLDRSPENCRNVLEWLCDHRDRFDWIYAAFNLIRALAPSDRPSPDAESERLFLETLKYFDIDIPYPAKLHESTAAVESLTRKLPTPSAQQHV